MEVLKCNEVLKNGYYLSTTDLCLNNGPGENCISLFREIPTRYRGKKLYNFGRCTNRTDTVLSKNGYKYYYVLISVSAIPAEYLQDGVDMDAFVIGNTIHWNGGF